MTTKRAALPTAGAGGRRIDTTLRGSTNERTLLCCGSSNDASCRMQAIPPASSPRPPSPGSVLTLLAAAPGAQRRILTNGKQQRRSVPFVPVRVSAAPPMAHLPRTATIAPPSSPAAGCCRRLSSCSSTRGAWPAGLEARVAKSEVAPVWEQHSQALRRPQLLQVRPAEEDGDNGLAAEDAPQLLAGEDPQVRRAEFGVLDSAV